jgi:hypothetical protein
VKALVWVVPLFIAIVAWLACAYVAFSRSTVRTVIRLDKGGESRICVWAWKYPHWRNWALTGLVLIPSLVAVGAGVWLAGKGSQDAGVEMPAQAVPSTSTAVSTTETFTAPATPSQTPTPLMSTAGATPSQHSPALVRTATSSNTPVTPSRTPTPVPTRTPTVVKSTSTRRPTPAPPNRTPTRTATQTATVVLPTSRATRTEVPTPTVTPSPTPSQTPTVTASATPGVVHPSLLKPLLGREYNNPITFEWRGALSPGQAYEVTVYHITSSAFIRSYLLTVPEWTVDLPAERVGEWRWWVSVVSYGSRLVSSSESMFWFNPLPGTRSPKPTLTPSATPTSPPR